MNGLWEKRGSAAYPVSEEAWSLFHKLPNGTRFTADVKDPTRRSGQQHRFWFALAHTLFDAQHKYTSFDNFRAHLLCYLGYCETGRLKDGTVVAIPKSLAFGRMPAEDFGALVDATLDFAEVMGFDRAELLAQTREFAGAPEPVA